MSAKSVALLAVVAGGVAVVALVSRPDGTEVARALSGAPVPPGATIEFDRSQWSPNGDGFRAVVVRLPTAGVQEFEAYMDSHAERAGIRRSEVPSTFRDQLLDSLPWIAVTRFIDGASLTMVYQPASGLLLVHKIFT